MRTRLTPPCEVAGDEERYSTFIQLLTEARGNPLLPGHQLTWAPRRRVLTAIADAVFAEQVPELLPPEPE
jgi:hypothetical protein